ncbi:nitroreductase family deazaflavin-dependent oxidoreductase [Amnibacterium flavum]|uniref:Nitroreductase family deazaflavin-dependent oxidoreductase n=1 Tax=Amnibacterium flavum TaxID=2173173 RepID=A0A2V1HUK5_9MICO|nr:nitroreductase family deazaflavin-dependent oxidoreductase [Amnibacterium flavum]PVZ96263.1 hypothetical protein DDQ50_07590 [Amnibacterium flavum]
MGRGDVRYVPPTRYERVFNAIVVWLSRRGIPFGRTQVLTVTGRKSGEPRSTPVNPFDIAGSRYLVGAHGTSQWVRNLRVAGSAELRRGRRVEEFQVTEVADSDKIPVLRAYIRIFWPAVKGCFGVPEHPTDEEIRAVAHLHPVFVIDKR